MVFSHPARLLPLLLVLCPTACGGDRDEAGASSSGNDDTGITGITVGQEGGDDGLSERLDAEGDRPANTCGDGTGDSSYEFTIIWVANSPEGTVSKIDTRTGTELARYRTGDSDTVDPSRTTVNLNGDVAIANRSGSVVKIRAKECTDHSGDGTVTTSTGPDNVLAWGEDECIEWVHPIAETSAGLGGPRGIAWNAVVVRNDDGSCYADPDVWVGWRDHPSSSVKIRRIDGATGRTDKIGSSDRDAEVTIQNWTGAFSRSEPYDEGDHLGVYGGASDAQGGFWAMSTAGALAYVEPEELNLGRWDDPWINEYNPDVFDDVNQAPVPYGIALDADGDPWMGAWTGHILHFDKEEQVFERFDPFPSATTVRDRPRLRGIAISADGVLWAARTRNTNTSCGLFKFDTLTGTAIETRVPVEGCVDLVGVSIDADGYVWGVDQTGQQAFKVDADTHAIDTVVTGLNYPYTYSDMTGAGLSLVVNTVG